MEAMVRTCVAMMFAVMVTMPLRGQTPRPFPGATTSNQAQRPPQPAEPAVPQAPQLPPSPAVAGTPAAPGAATLGVPVYPAARFLASYDAGRGQRYFLFGTSASFAEIVTYYRGQLDERGDLVFKDPPTHMFGVGRFREETMAFPPGVTVKDWTSGGSQGYPNPVPGAQPARFPTVIMIVPAPTATAAAPK